MSRNEEIWLGVVGFPDYEVSNLGRVRSWKQVQPTTLKPSPVRSRSGKVQNLSVKVREDNRSSTRTVHSLVLGAFVGPCPDGMECCHKDGDPTNNRLDNLRWDTHLSNAKDSILHGTHKSLRKPRGATHPNAKITEGEVCAIRSVVYKYGDAQKVANRYGISTHQLRRIRIGKDWKHVPAVTA